MKTFASRVALLSLVVVAVGCSSKSDFAEIDLGTTTVGTYQVNVNQEAAFGPNQTTKYALMATPGKPDKIECWYGEEKAMVPHVNASFDAKDNDWDCLVPTPAVTMPTDKLWFTLTTGTMTATGSATPR